MMGIHPIPLQLAAVLSVLLALAGTEAGGQQANPEGAPAVSLKVKREQNTSRTTSPGVGYARRSHYTGTRESISSINLAIEVRNLTTSPETVELKWYFVAESTDGSEPRIFDEGSKTLDLTVPGVVAREQVESQTLTSTARTRDWVRRSETGSKVSGYIVLVMAGDKILKVDASSRSLEEMARSPDGLKKLRAGSGTKGKKKP